MPVQSEKKRPTPHPTSTGEQGRAMPSLHAAWDFMEEEDKRAIEEIVAKYTELAKEG